MLCVCVESPLRGDYERNVLYAEACMLDCLRRRGEAPFLGHLLYPRVLDDAAELDRKLGIDAHCAWVCRADILAVYTDLGVTDGMRKAIELALVRGIPVEQRALGAEWMQEFLAEVRGTDGVVS
jgi:hypothetical protein